MERKELNATATYFMTMAVAIFISIVGIIVLYHQCKLLWKQMNGFGRLEKTMITTTRTTVAKESPGVTNLENQEPGDDDLASAHSVLHKKHRESYHAMAVELARMRQLQQEVKSQLSSLQVLVEAKMGNPGGTAMPTSINKTETSTSSLRLGEHDKQA